jgi:D-alanyl-D-alanine carboxypeptidase (penicillin-binding protein 5/6)
MTCILALENADEKTEVVFSENAARQPKVHLGASKGETFYLGDLLHSLMLESHNDSAVAIAEAVAGDVKKFASLMNRKAKEIGCENTYFITPNGLDAENGENFHHTTATDLCKIMEYCVWESPQKEQFIKITQTPFYQGTNGKNNYAFTNRNSLLSSMDGLISGKTGFTAKAGYCYVAAFEKDGERYCIALLACGWPNNKTYKWKDARSLLEYGMENYNNVDIEEERVKKTILVDGYISSPSFEYLNRHMNIEIVGVFTKCKILLSKDECVQQKIEIQENITLPIKRGQKLGEGYLYIGDHLIETIPIISQNSADEWSLWNVFCSIIQQYIDF